MQKFWTTISLNIEKIRYDLRFLFLAFQNFNAKKTAHDILIQYSSNSERLSIETKMDIIQSRFLVKSEFYYFQLYCIYFFCKIFAWKVLVFHITDSIFKSGIFWQNISKNRIFSAVNTLKRVP